MPDLDDRIAALDDATAIQLLTKIADTLRRRDEAAFAAERDETFRAALADAVEREDVPVPNAVSEGDLARAALSALAEDDELRDWISTFMDGAAQESLAGVETILAVGALLVALQIGWKYKSADGRVTFEKKPLVGKNFVDFAGQLMGWLKTK